jgi:hypothetical protein
MTDRLPGRNEHDDTDIPEVTGHEDGIEDELSDQDLENVSGGTITFQPPHNGIPGNPI